MFKVFPVNSVTVPDLKGTVFFWVSPSLEAKFFDFCFTIMTWI